MQADERIFLPEAGSILQQVLSWAEYLANSTVEQSVGGSLGLWTQLIVIWWDAETSLDHIYCPESPGSPDEADFLPQYIHTHTHTQPQD